MIEKIGRYWEGWHHPPLHWYGISINVTDNFSPALKSLQQKLRQMCRLRRWLSFKMRKELRRRKQFESLAIIMQKGEEAMEAMEQ